MRLFYLTPYPNGYIRVRFVDPATGLPGTAKSTHKKDKDEALAVVYDWIKNGVPEERVNARKKPAPARVLSDSEKIENLLKGYCPESGLAGLLASLLSKLAGAQPSGVASAAPAVSAAATEVSATADTVTATASVVPVPEAVCQTADSDGDADGTETFKTTEFSKRKKERCEKTIGDIPLIQFLTDSWTPEKSECIREKRAHDFACEERHCYEMRGIIPRYFVPYFGEDTLVKDVGYNDFKEFFMFMKMDMDKANATVNKAINAAAVPFKYAFEQGWLEVNHMAGVKRFSTKNELRRAIPTDEEVAKIFRLSWRYEYQKLASLVAAFCGLRASELSGLRVCDIGDDVIHVRHAWSDKDGLKPTKNFMVRDVPVPPEISRALLEHAKESRVYSDLSYVFFSSKNGQRQPILPSVYEDGFYDALNKIGVSEEQRKERNIVFHSLRHYYAKQMLDRLELQNAQQALGHLSPKMTQHYADHQTRKDIELLKGAMNDSYRFILDFPVGATA